MQHDSLNTIFTQAADLVNFTSRHIFLTGKAGTGKTTFLKFIQATTQKKAIVVAPTGVAAINAGGVTMHSLFQLPFGPFVPTPGLQINNSQITNKHSLFKNIHFTSSKRELLQAMELLIVDEVSMVRCDMLDAVDAILRHIRRNSHLPFGGVQVVYIGDLFQLPPVIPADEWTLLKQFYKSPFFFEAQVIKEARPVYIELQKIYRQNEQNFIDLLNRIRNNNIIENDLAQLNRLHQPGFVPPPGEKYITLSSHNHKADIINQAALNKLSGKAIFFKADVEGDFAEKAHPTDFNLQLKEGAQVMFIKNDSGKERRFYNGKLATIKKVSPDKIIVETDDAQELELEKETWKNIRYNYDREKDAIDEELLGSFKQYPIRLAWAITVHKSQGLTFEKAIIDAGASFAPGQVYVALSRCTSLSGVILHSAITSNVIATDSRVLAFAAGQADEKTVAQILFLEKEKFQTAALLAAFDFTVLQEVFIQWEAQINKTRFTDANHPAGLYNQLMSRAMLLISTGQKFQLQLENLLVLQNEKQILLRVNKAVLYFADALHSEIILPLQKHIVSLTYARKISGYLQTLQKIETQLIKQLAGLNKLYYKQLIFDHHSIKAYVAEIKRLAKKDKKKKGDSMQESLALFRQGNTKEEIAKLRNLTTGTIETHLARFVLSGDLSLEQLVLPHKIKAILAFAGTPGITAFTIKQQLGNNFSYCEITTTLKWHSGQIVNENRPV